MLLNKFICPNAIMSNVIQMMIVVEIYCPACPCTILAGFPAQDFGAWVDYNAAHVCPNCGEEIIVTNCGHLTENAQFCDN